MPVTSPDKFLYTPEGTYLWTRERLGAAWCAAHKELHDVLRWKKELGVTRVVFMCGLPGSGKSTWLARHGREDTLYFDATLLTRTSRRRLLKEVRKVDGDIPVVAVVMETPLHVCQVRNAARSVDRQVPLDTILTMEATQDEISEDEGFAEVTRILYAYEEAA